MKYLYRIDSAGDYWYNEESVNRYIPIVEAKPVMLRNLYGGLLWYDKHNKPWALIGDGRDFSSKADAIIALAEELNEREGTVAECGMYWSGY